MAGWRASRGKSNISTGVKLKALSESFADDYLIYNKHITTRLAFHDILSDTKGISLVENTIEVIVNNDLDEHKVNNNKFFWMGIGYEFFST